MMVPPFEEIFNMYLDFLSGLTQERLGILKSYYRDITSSMKAEFENTDFMKKLNENLIAYNEEYIVKSNFELFEKLDKIEMLIKPYDSMIEKCFRKDILEKNALHILLEGNYDDLIPYAEHTPLNCFEKFSDIIRTRITTRYMDGALILLDKLKELANECQLKWDEPDYKTEFDGYYAIHLNVIHNFELPDLKRDTISRDCKVEIQINTAVQNLLVELTHEYYKISRKRLEKPDIKWQWLCDCEEFIPYYLGHITHYVEGMMVNIRDKVTL